MAAQKPQKRRQIEEGNMPYGIEYWYARYLSVVDSWGKKSLLRNALLGVLIGAAITVVASFLPFSSILQSLCAVPAAVCFFLVGLALTRHWAINHPEHVPVRERYSAKKRQQQGLFLIVGAVILVVIVNASLPYVIGGVFFLSMLFTCINTIRRTPEEVQRDIAGVIDPRDIVEEPEEDVNDEAYGELEAILLSQQEEATTAEQIVDEEPSRGKP